MAITPEQFLQAVQDAHTRQATELSPEEASQRAAMALLAEIGGGRVGESDLTFEGQRFVLPEQYRGNVREARRFLERWEKQQSTQHTYSKVFRYRPYDVAHAVTLALKEAFGTTGVGETTMTFFGPQPPQFVDVPTGVNTSVQVPWETTAFPPLGPEAQIQIGHTYDREHGHLGTVEVLAPRAVKAQVDGLFKLIEKHLKASSIYRGKALVGGDRVMPKFLDVRKVDASKVVYSDDVLHQLDANVWSLIEHTPLMRELGQPLKRAVLLEGPYGTGKSLAAFLTAQRAEAHGWTFLFVRPGDDLDNAMRTAQLYSPAVVFFEDIDVVAEAGDPAKVSKLLDSFDGIGAKGAEVIAILTTNRKDKIHKGMLRPGRLDAVISINALDQAGVEKLIKAQVPADMLRVIDYAAVHSAFDGFTPAFASEAISRTMRYAIAREGKKPGFLTTADFVGAAQSLRPQLELMATADEEKTTPTADQALRALVADVVDATRFVNDDGDSARIYGPEEDVSGMEVDREALV
ncbi:AAA family ATPase [Streptomyces sparsogenes]|uniref:AAA family ATPase n=1 Tax=Streptomyces sparsogenes TaxID=67365 RepID=UPI00384FF6EA